MATSILSQVSIWVHGNSWPNTSVMAKSVYVWNKKQLFSFKSFKKTRGIMELTMIYLGNHFQLFQTDLFFEEFLFVI